jgi:hypothetical protein
VGLKERTETDGFKKAILLGVHEAEGFLVMIVMPDHVEQPVQGVKDELAGPVVFEDISPALGFVEAARDIGIDRCAGCGHRKGQDIGRRRIVVPALMKQAHPGIAHDLDGEAEAARIELLDEPGQSVAKEFKFIGSKSTSAVVDLEMITTRRLVGLRRFRRLTPGGVTVGGGF